MLRIKLYNNESMTVFIMDKINAKCNVSDINRLYFATEPVFQIISKRPFQKW